MSHLRAMVYRCLGPLLRLGPSHARSFGKIPTERAFSRRKRRLRGCNGSIDAEYPPTDAVGRWANCCGICSHVGTHNHRLPGVY